MQSIYGINLVRLAVIASEPTIFSTEAIPVLIFWSATTPVVAVLCFMECNDGVVACKITDFALKNVSSQCQRLFTVKCLFPAMSSHPKVAAGFSLRKLVIVHPVKYWLLSFVNLFNGASAWSPL